MAASRLCSDCVPTPAFREGRRAVLPLPCTEQVGMRPILIFFVLLADYQSVIVNFLRLIVVPSPMFFHETWHGCISVTH